MNDHTAAVLALFFNAALGEATRLKITQLLCERDEASSGEIQEAVGKPWPNISHHLSIMRTGGVVESRREGQRVLYRIVHRDFVAPLQQLIAGIPGASK